MASRLLCFASSLIVFVLVSPMVLAQEDERYDFDGVADVDPQPADPTDWMTSENWSDGGFDPDIAFGPLLPDFGTRVEIQTSTVGVNVPVIGPGDTAEAFGVRIGRFGGEGRLIMNGGTLDIANSCTAFPFTCNRRLRVGAADVGLPEDRNPGTFDLSDGTVTTDTLWIGSGSHGQMNMSGGEVNTRGDLSMDWSFDAGSNLSLTGGVVNVGTNLRMYRNSTLDIDGGEMFVTGFAGLGYSDASITQIPNVDVNISNGLLESASFLRVEGSVTVDGGILRADSFEENLSTGTVEINSTGILQFNNAQESVLTVEALIASMVITTSEVTPLIVEVVDVGGTDFTQVSTGIVGTPGDFNGDGNVDGFDLIKWQRGESPSQLSASDYQDWEMNFVTLSGPAVAAATIPEPSSVVLVALGCLALAATVRPMKFRDK